MPANRLVALAPAAALLLLAACGGDQTPAEEGAGASGEILPGSVSDAMIPLDSLQSQPPLMRTEAGGGGAAGEEAADGEDAAAAGEPVPDDAAPEPVEEPSQ